MSYVIAIPSYKRSILLLYKTLNFLERHSIDPKLIHIFIIEEDRADYNQIPSYLYNDLISGVKGIAKQREFIDHYFEEGAHIVSLDDDIEDIVFAKPEEELPLDEFFKQSFELCKKEDAYLWGIYPVGNPFYASHNKWYSTHLTFICGCFYGYINRPKLEDIKCVLTYNNGNMEDFERSIRYWYYDKKIIRFNTICVKTKYFGTDGGGMGNLQSRMGPMEECVRLLHAHYPTITKVYLKKNGIYNLRLNDHSGQTLRIKNK
jgi:hypothetical protein